MIRTLKDLASPAGAGELLRLISGINTPDKVEAIMQSAASILQRSPDLADIPVKVIPGLENGYYDTNTDTIILGLASPAAVEHEAGHAANLRRSAFYAKFLKATRGLAKINNTLAIPATLALRAFVKDKDVRNEAFNILSGLSASVAGPGLVEELSASIDAMKSSPDKWESAKTLLPAFLSHAISSSLPIVAYQAGRHWD